MTKRQPVEGCSHSGTLLFLLPYLLLLAPPSSLAAPPLLLSLVVPWAQQEQADRAGGTWKQATLESLGESSRVLTAEDEKRLLNAFLERGDRGWWRPATPDDGDVEWELPRDPKLFLLTEETKVLGRRRRRSESEQDEMATHRVKRTGSISVGGSRMRTSIGGGVLGSSGGRGGFGGLGASRGMGGPVGGGIAGGPSLSIVNPLDVLRQRLLLEIARRRMRQSEDQILANRELLKSIGKRETLKGEEQTEIASQLTGATKKPTSMQKM